MEVQVMQVLKGLMPFISLGVFLVGIGVTYGMTKTKIAALEADVKDLKTIAASVSAIEGDIKAIRVELQLRKK